MPQAIKIFLCDDHNLFRQGLRRILENEEDMKIMGEAGDGQKMLDIFKKTGGDIILMDIDMPRMDGITATYKIKKLSPKTNIIILTEHDDNMHIFDSIRAGATGYLLKDVSIEELIDAIRKVYRGEALIQPVIAAKVLKEFVFLDKRKMKNGNKFYDDLTEREREVLRLITLGGTNKQIAQKLEITEKTVKNHISSIFQTLHVKNRTQAAMYAYRNLGKDI